MDEQIQSTNASSNNKSELKSSSHATESIPKIKLPFPPVIDPQDLISLRESPDGTRKLPSRAPNAFIIFRKQFVKAARDEGYFLPMTVISSMASEAWEAESEEVKLEYRRIAKEAHIKRKAMYPKSSNRRRRKDRWNIVSFKSTSSDSISAITSRIPNDQPQSQCNNNSSEETPSNSPSFNLENMTPISSPEFSSDTGDNSPLLNTIFPVDLDYLMTDNSAYITLDTAPLPYGYCFEVGSNNGTLEDPTFGLYPSPNIYPSDEDSIQSTSPYLDVEQFYNDYMNSSIITTNTDDENQSIMTSDSMSEFNSIIESNIQQNDFYNDWQGFHQLHNLNFKTIDSTMKSREEKLANEDTTWISEQLDMLIDGNCGGNVIAAEDWLDFSTNLANGCFGEALGISV